MKNTLPITLPDYYRAFQVMHGILLNEDSVSHKACLFFANAGAEILKMHFKLPAVPMAGAAFYLLHDDSSSVLSFAELSQGNVTSHSQAFHAWVQCGEWIIDFMAPLFPEALKDTGVNVSIPRKMFQRNIADMDSSLEGLSKSGDYLLIPNIELTMQLQNGLAEKLAYADLVYIAARWFTKTPNLGTVYLFHYLRRRDLINEYTVPGIPYTVPGIPRIPRNSPARNSPEFEGLSDMI